MSSEGRLEVRSIVASWDATPVLRDVSFEVGVGEFVVLMGPNGSGKTTLLRTIAGFERPTSGEISLGGKSIADLPVHRRGIGMLFQDPALFPRRTAWENVAYGLEIDRRPRAAVQGRVAEMFELLHLGGLEDRAPEALSGGERQRVALARTLAPGPSLVLLDEPFASIDPEIRSEMRAVFRGALRRLGVAAVHVTHDREEGLMLGDRVLILLGGRIEQSGTPSDVFRRPESIAVARFLGYNILRDGGQVLAVHPTDVVVEAAGSGRQAEIEASGIVGVDQTVIARLATGERIESRSPVGSGLPEVGAVRSVRWERSLALAR